MSNTRTEAFPVDASAAVAAVDVEMDDIIEPLPKATLDERKVLTLPPSITWRQGLAAGWQGKPALQFYGREFLLGIIICMAQIPESIAFAYLARVNGATGAFAAIVATFLAEPAKPGGNGAGVELLFPSVMLAGVLMLGVWALHLDRFISLLPLPVMIGFCNGLAFVIGRAQLHPFYAPVCGQANATGAAAGHRRELASGPCTASGYKEGAEMGFMILIMLGAMLIMEFVPKIPKPSSPDKKPLPLKVLSYIVIILLELPSSMLSIIFSIAVEFALVRPLGFRTDTIGDKEKFVARDALPIPFFVDDQYDMNAYSAPGAISQIITQGILLCAVGCIESLMTAQVVSSYTKTPHHSGLVVGAMGAGNIISGFLGGMGGNAMIGLSTIACLNGGRGRVAPLTTALGILVCVSSAYEVLNFIPMAALAGIMIVVVLHTFKWFSLPMLVAALLSKEKRDAVAKTLGCCPVCSVHRKVIRTDVGVMLVVTVLVIMTNIVIAVGAGLALSCMVYAWQSAHEVTVVAYLSSRPPPNAGPDAKPVLVKTYEVAGPLFFAATRDIGNYFSPEDDPEHVVCTFSGGGALFDYTMMDSIVALTAAYKAEGKSITFHALRPSAVKMLKKADYWTKEVVYVEESVSEHHAHAASMEGGDYSKHANIKRRITGLAAPSWSSTPGTGIYDTVPYEPPLHGSQLQTTTPQLHPSNGAV